ncbi:hypothetical protein ACFE04_025395 [Oxalis oulophora]
MAEWLKALQAPSGQSLKALGSFSCWEIIRQLKELLESLTKKRALTILLAGEGSKGHVAKSEPDLEKKVKEEGKKPTSAVGILKKSGGLVIAPQKDGRVRFECSSIGWIHMLRGVRRGVAQSGLILILCIVLHSMDIFQSLLFKLAPSLAGRALCSLMGFYSAGLTLTILLAALLTWDANPYSMLPGSSHQPHVPEHQVPQEHFPEHAVAHRSEPGEIELKQPLLLDQERQTELEKGRMSSIPSPMVI